MINYNNYCNLSFIILKSSSFLLKNDAEEEQFMVYSTKLTKINKIKVKNKQMANLVTEIYDQESDTLTLTIKHDVTSIDALKMYVDKLHKESRKEKNYAEDFYNTLPQSFNIPSSKLKALYETMISKKVSNHAFSEVMSEIIQLDGGISKIRRTDANYYMKNFQTRRQNTKLARAAVEESSGEDQIHIPTFTLSNMQMSHLITTKHVQPIQIPITSVLS